MPLRRRLGTSSQVLETRIDAALVFRRLGVVRCVMHRLPFIVFIGCTMFSRADEVIQVTWKTQHAATPPKVAQAQATILPTFRFALGALPESSIVALALSQPTLLGLSPAQAATLKPMVAERYALIAKSPVYSVIPSVLPYCFAEKRPSQGLALVHVPDGMRPQTPVICFLHGYGGSFLWYQHLLVEHFPDHLIICPVHGINTSTIAPDYVKECLIAVGVQLGCQLSNPVLMGLSAGGFGACDLYTRHPQRFAGLICLAAYPPQDTTVRFGPDSKAAFIAGSDEYFVRSGEFERRVASVRQRAPATRSFVVPNAEHFFLLTHTKGTMGKLHEWLALPW